MDSAVASTRATPAAPIVFQDALGERRRLETSPSDVAELLCLRGELTAIPSFEFALRERASRLSAFRHAYYGRVRSVDRLNDPAATLAVVSDHTRGVRLSTLLSEKGPRPITIDINVALHFVRQLVSAVAVLHESARDVAHGALAPERIIVTPNARIVVVEYVLGAALEQLRFSHERYWRELRIALPSSPGLPRFDHRADVTQIGLVALSLVLGRMLHEDEYPARVGDLVASASAISAKGGAEPLAPGLRAWLTRALQLDPRHSFTSAFEARTELDNVLSGDQGSVATLAVPQPIEPPAPTREEPRREPEHPAVREEESTTNAVERVVDEPTAAVKDEPGVPERAVARVRVQPVAAILPVHDETPESAVDDEPEPIGETAFARFGASKQTIAIAVAVVAIGSVAVFGVRRYFVARAAAPANATGTLSITTNPSGAALVVDGESRGITPLTVSLKPGTHNVEIRGAGEPRVMPITIAAGAQVNQYIELPVATPVAPGQLQIRTEPGGAQVTVDDIPRGRSPLLVEGLAPGEHSVSVESEFGTVKQTVMVAAATTASLVVPLRATAEGVPLSGWISVSTPVDVQILENKRLLGSSQTDRIMVSAGRHDFEILNETLGYRVVKTVQVPAGKLTPVKVEWPKGTIAVNALPWAEVWIDGERAGETPLGNLSLPIGPHEIVFRHPELGELRHAATVTLGAPVRVSVDLRKKP